MVSIKMKGFVCWLDGLQSRRTNTALIAEMQTSWLCETLIIIIFLKELSHNVMDAGCKNEYCGSVASRLTRNLASISAYSISCTCSLLSIDAACLLYSNLLLSGKYLACE